MYGLDINFLNDRPEYKPVVAEPRRRGGTPGDRRPLFMGAGVALALLALAGGSWFYLQTKNNDLRGQKADLEGQLGALKKEQANLADINAEAAKYKEEVATLAGVFNAIKPWSATFGEIGSRTPPRVRVLGITQKPLPAAQQRPASPSPSPSSSPSAAASPAASGSPAASPKPSPTVAASPPPLEVILIAGRAISFDDVNDFLLVLQNSKFFKRDKTQITEAKLGEPRSVQLIQIGKEKTSTVKQEDIPKLPPEVSFIIQTELTNVPASELIQELESQKATGLVTRIEQLQQKGVVKP